MLRTDVWDCVRAIWTEYIIYEIGPWGKGGTCTWGSKQANVTTLRRLRRDAGLPGFGALEK